MGLDCNLRLNSSAWKKTWVTIPLFTTCPCLAHSLCLRKTKNNMKKFSYLLAFDFDPLSEYNVPFSLFFSHSIPYSAHEIPPKFFHKLPFHWLVYGSFFPMAQHVWIITLDFFLSSQLDRKSWERAFHLICILGSDYVAQVKNPVSVYYTNSN